MSPLPWIDIPLSYFCFSFINSASVSFHNMRCLRIYGWFYVCDTTNFHFGPVGLICCCWCCCCYWHLVKCVLTAKAFGQGSSVCNLVNISFCLFNFKCQGKSGEEVALQKACVFTFLQHFALLWRLRLSVILLIIKNAYFLYYGRCFYEMML